MTQTGTFVRSALIDGLLVLLPFVVVAVIVMKTVEIIKPLTAPLVESLPARLHFHRLFAFLLFLFISFMLGLFARTRTAQDIGIYFENKILGHIPGYSILRSFTRRIGDTEESAKFAPAFAEIEDALVPAFIVEEHSDSFYTIFIPSAPTPAVGSIYIIAKHRVHLVDVPFLKAVKCVSGWGNGSAELIKAMREPGEKQV